MANIKTNYLGIELKNPLIAGASNLVANTNNLKKLEDSGVGAIVYKSLFEEQIQYENLQTDEITSEFEERHAEMTSVFSDIKKAGPEPFLEQLRKAKESVDIPLIASLNAVYLDTWTDYAQKIAETGVDALELNFYNLPKEDDLEGEDIVSRLLNITKQVKAAVDIPIAVKLSPFYTNIYSVIKQIDDAGVDGFVLFNRLFQPKINIETEKHEFPWNLSKPGDNRLALRFAGLLYGKTQADVCASNGIYEGEHVIEMLLAGAQCTQVVSTLYQNGIKKATEILKDLEDWMDKKGYNTIDEFRGKLSLKNVKDPFAYQRAQYVDILWNSDNVYKKFKQV
jgi:dihydroorotate dehydrogenase (fumarate)